MILQVKNPIIEVHNLTVSYNHQPVVWNVDFSLKPKTIVGIIGPNGSGKTTLLKTLMGLKKSDSGYIKIFGKPLDSVREKVSYVPQRESVDWDFPASVLDVVSMGRYRKGNILKRSTKEDKEIVLQSIEEVGLSAYKNRQISQLSGGQQQRVFIARALAQQAEVYIMDEPFAGVDASTEDAILQLFTKMREAGKTLVVVHHDLQTAKKYFNWLVLMNTRLVASGPTEKVFTEELLSETYGGKLTLLSQMGKLLKNEQFSVREKGE